MDTEAAALTILVGAEAAHAFSAFMPSYFTIQTFAGSPASVEALRSGYPPALVFNGILGLTAVWLTKSWLPLLGVALASAGMIYLYERAIGKARLATG